MFVYMAGHGAVVKDDYYFVAHDTRVKDIATNGRPADEDQGGLRRLAQPAGLPLAGLLPQRGHHSPVTSGACRTTGR